MTTTIETPAKPENKVLLLRLDRIRRDGGIQSRARLCSETAARYAEDMKAGAVFPRMIVFRGVDDRTPDDKTIYDWLTAGFHRYEAYDQRGQKSAECIIREGSRREAVLYSVSDNHKHGLQRTNDDKRYATRLLLEDEDWWDKTDTWIADTCHVSKPLVKVIRDVMEAEWTLEAKKEAEQAQQQSEQGNVTVNGLPSENGCRPRKGRNRHGGTRTIHTAKCDTKGKQGGKIKPVYLETETKGIAHKMAQVVRSIPKSVRQAKALGWSWEKYVEENRKAWDAIPVTQDG